MTVELLQRGLSADNDMAIKASEYQRSTASIVVEAIVGLLTGGVGAVAFEAYHAYSKSRQQREFTELADTLLQGLQSMPHQESGFDIPYKDGVISVRPQGNNIEVKFGEESATIKDKLIGEVRENLKREIVLKDGAYGKDTVKRALQDGTGTQRSLAIAYLESKTHLHKFDHLDTEQLVEACVSLVEGHLSKDEIESEIDGLQGKKANLLDSECLELIKGWQQKPLSEREKINYVSNIDAREVERSRQSSDEKQIRTLLAEIFLPEKSWQNDTTDPGVRLKSVLVDNAGLLARIYSQPAMLQEAGLPLGLSNVVQNTLDDLKDELRVPAGLVNESTVSIALTSLPTSSYFVLSQNIDNHLDNFEFRSLGGVDLLASLGDLGEGNFQTFLKNIFTHYFDNQAVVDKRAMLSSYLTQSGSKDSEEMKLVSLLKGGGPYLQKVLQLFGDKATGDLKAALDELKTGLNPINKEIVKAITAGIIDKSGGAIDKINISRSLGAASVGETVLANIHWKNRDEPQEVVLKLLRPGIRLRADRELDFFEAEAKKLPGMLKTFQGIAEQIQVEMDLKREADNVRLAQVYNQGFDNLSAMKLVEKVPPSQGYMVLQKAPGTTVKHAFEDLKTKIGNWNPRTSDSTCYTTSSKMASGIEALASKWIEEGIFGSGFYHGDLHSGNIMYSDATGMLTAIDMGNADQMSLVQRRAVFKMVLAAGIGSTEVFVRNYEKVLSNEGREQIVDKREMLTSKTREIMEMVSDPGERIMKILNAANELGLEIPATVSNFSRSQMMLQNAIDKVNDLNQTAILKLESRIRSLAVTAGITEGSIGEIKQHVIRQMEEFKDSLPAEALEVIKPRLDEAIRLSDHYLSESHDEVNFSEVIMKVVKDHKASSVQLAYGDILQLMRR